MKKQKGITLIALVVTIVVLIILAGVAINLSIGENGIFKKAMYAREEYSNATQSEQERLNELYSKFLVATNDDAQITISVQDLNTLIEQKIEESNKSTLEKISKLDTRVTSIEEIGVSSISLERIETLSSPTQLTHAGFYSFEQCDETIDDDVADTEQSFTDYSVGDFKGFLLATHTYSDRGCRYGTLIITSPRFKDYVWIARIWEYEFRSFIKVGI